MPQASRRQRDFTKKVWHAYGHWLEGSRPGTRSIVKRELL